MINKLNEYQNKYLTFKSKEVIKSIESGLLTGIRDNKGNLKDGYIKYYNNVLYRYNKLLDEIKIINNSFFNDNPEYINKPIILYRGLQINIEQLNNMQLNNEQDQFKKNHYKYNDTIPTSYSFDRKKAMGFITDNGVLLKYKCYDKSKIILNYNNFELNESEVILQPNNYKIINKNKLIHKYLWKNNYEKFNYYQFDITL
jgi:hypothetical protein